MNSHCNLNKKCKTCSKPLYNNNTTGYCRHHLDTSGEKNSFFGKKHKKETVENLRKIRQGSKASEETKQKMSKTRKGMPNGLLGYKHREESKIKMSISGKGRVFSEIHKKRIGDANRKRILSNKTKQKISKSLEGKYTGEKSHSWKGGITPLYKSMRTTYKYRQWRSDVFTRDSFICQKCFQKKNKLEAHHIKKMVTIVKDYNIKNLNDSLDCEELWDINNGITLCQFCHKQEHKKN